MLKKEMNVLIYVLFIGSLILNILLYLGSSPPLSTEIKPENASNLNIMLSKTGDVSISGYKGKKIRRIKVGEKRPINIEKILPGKKIKTLDTIVVFTGSPACMWHDGYVYCE